MIRGLRPIGWGFASQGCSSATSFLLTVVGAQAVGAEGLGAIALAFAGYLVALGLARSLVTEPLVASSTAVERATAVDNTRHGLTATAAIGLGGSAVLLAVATQLDDELGSGLAALAPWLLAALLQDYGRSILFRDGRERAAASTDFAWLASMVVSLPLVVIEQSVWTVATVWGIGALTGAGAALVLLGALPSGPAVAFRHWRKECWPLARWLGAEGVVYMGGMLLVSALVVDLLGAAALGGLRAVQSIFGPLTLITPALMLPGLPQISRAASRSSADARRAAIWYSGLAVGLTSCYLALLWLVADDLLGTAFGDGFRRYDELVVPVGTAQLVVALGLGFAILVRAERRGAPLFAARAAGVSATIVAVVPLARAMNVEGAAWALTLGLVVTTLVLVWAGLRPALGRPAPRSRDATPRRPSTAALPEE